MDMFSSQGSVGVGVAFAALSILHALLNRLEASGTLKREHINAILVDALAQLPDNNNAAQQDARRLIESLKK